MSGKEWLESSYSPVMEDVARRLTAAERSLQDVNSAPEHPFAWVGCEIAAVQIRKVCELILLGSTLAHMLEGGHQLHDNKWHPKDAFAQLDKINEYPLPLPVDIELNKNSPGAHHITPKSRPLPYATLGRIYGMCGDLLHVPTARQVTKGRLPSYDVGQLSDWVSGFKSLAEAHVLMLPRRETVLLCRWSGQINDQPELTLLNAKGESTLNLEEYPPFELLQ